MSSAAETAVGTMEMVDRASALVQPLRDRRHETDELRRLPDATVEEIRELGLLGVATPRENRGSDLGPDGILEVSRELGRGCGATGWCGGNWAIHGLLMSMFPVEAQHEVFAADQPFPVISTGFSPLRAKTEPTDGGTLVTGQWDFASGVDHADWVVTMAIGEQGPLAHLTPASDLKIVDTWQTSGLRGTGSKDVACERVFVPEHRLLAMAGPGEGESLGRELYDSPWFRLPLGSVFGAGIIGSMLGMANGALEVFVARTQEKIGGLSGVKVGDRADVHERIGAASSAIAAADALARATYAEMRSVAESGVEYTMVDRVRWRRDVAWAGHSAIGAVNLLFEVGGAHVLWLDDQLHQFQRDITAAGHHYGMAASSLYVGSGRAVLGLDPGVAMV
jgi:alkylation response protein AidB-like acyl-CoA dehydrogenase